MVTEEKLNEQAEYVRNELTLSGEAVYAEFEAKLNPNLEKDVFLGVRVPVLRSFAKKYVKNPEKQQFLDSIPHKYYEENLLHAILIGEIKNFDECLDAFDKFLPFVDNWAVCDTPRPKVFAKQKDRLMEKILVWSQSEHTYTCRFGIEMLMNFFLDDESFKPSYLEIPASIRRDDYYVNMMIAWFFATALTEQWDAALPYIENKRLDAWTHNKTIQKSIESFRIDSDKKEYLKILRTKVEKSK